MIKRALIFLMAMAAGVVVPTAQANPVRSAPTRPGAVTTKKEDVKTAPVQKAGAKSAVPVASKGALKYVGISSVAERYGLTVSWAVPQRRVELKDGLRRIEIEAVSRNMWVDGVRVFLGDPSRIVDGKLEVSAVDAERLFPGLLNPGGAGPRKEVKVIAIDPGHGGEDAGTENKALGLKEKEFALDVSLRLKRALEAKGYRVVMTRETDVYLGRGERAIIANAAKADLFVSVHFNALERNPQATKGVEVFTFAPQFQRSTDAWSPGKPDDTEALPAPVNAFDSQSVALAHTIHRTLLAKLKTDDRGQKIAHWTVLRAVQCPAVLVEAGFLSNDAEGKKIATPEYRQQIAEAIAEGLANYAALVGPAKE